MSKISELSDGGSLVSSDYLIAVRSGGNVKVRMDSINVDQVDLGDNEFIRLGNSQDLTMVHTSTQSIINQAGTGDLLIQKAGATKLTINASGIDVTGSVTADTGEITRLGLGVAAHASAALLIDTTDQHIRLTNGSELGVIELDSSGHLNIWAHGDGETINLKTGSGAGNNVLSVVGNNVGIGNSSPNSYESSARQLVVGSGSGSNGITITSATNGSSAIFFADGTSSGQQYDCFISANHTDSALLFGTGATGSADMTLDASGNLLVGTSLNNPTSSGVNVAGQEFSTTGGVRSTVASNAAATFNRKTDDGDIVLFRKDGTTVGSIGVDNNDNFYIGATTAGHAGFYFGNTSVAPMAAAVRVDSTIDLGTSTHRFKDLHLSGGVDISQGAAPQTAIIDFTKTINDDAVFSFTPDKTIGVIYIYGRNVNYDEVFGIVSYRTTSSAFCTKQLDPNSVISVSTSVLTGTTGTNGQVTISAAQSDGKIYIENRRGVAISIGIHITGQ